MTPTILWTLIAVIAVVGLAGLLVLRNARARNPAPEERLRPVHQECVAGGHNYLVHGGGYRCVTCGNHVSSSEGELYGLAEDGRQERRRETR